MLRAQGDHWKHQIHQQLASRATHIAPPTRRDQYPPVDFKQDHLSGNHQGGFIIRTLETQEPEVPRKQLNDRPLPTPPTRRNQYPPVDLKQDPVIGRNTNHQDGLISLKIQVPPTRLTDRPLPTPPLARKQFSYEHTSVQRSASLDILHKQEPEVPQTRLNHRPLPTPKRKQYPPVDLKQDPVLGRNTNHQDGFITLKVQVPPTRLTDRPLPTPPLARKQFSYEHASVQRSASLDILTQDKKRDPKPVNVRTRPLPPRRHPGESDEHHYANQDAIKQTLQDEPPLKPQHEQPHQKQKRRQDPYAWQQEQLQQRQQEQLQQRQQWQTKKGEMHKQEIEPPRQEQQKVDSGNTTEGDYVNQAMIQLLSKPSPR